MGRRAHRTVSRASHAPSFLVAPSLLEFRAVESEIGTVRVKARGDRGDRGAARGDRSALTMSLGLSEARAVRACGVRKSRQKSFVPRESRDPSPPPPHAYKRRRGTQGFKACTPALFHLSLLRLSPPLYPLRDPLRAGQRLDGAFGYCSFFAFATIVIRVEHAFVLRYPPRTFTHTDARTRNGRRQRSRRTDPRCGPFVSLLTFVSTRRRSPRAFCSNDQCEMILRTLTVPGEDSSTWYVLHISRRRVRVPVLTSRLHGARQHTMVGRGPPRGACGCGGPGVRG